MAVSDEQRLQFQLIRHSVWSGQLCMVPLKSKKTGAAVPTLCIASRPPTELSLDGEEDPIILYPVALMLPVETIFSQLDIPDNVSNVKLATFTDDLEPIQILDYLRPS